MTEVFAPAKVNLTLHVTGQRDDGYHLLDSLVCFPAIGDRLTFTPASEMSLVVHGAPELPTDGSNLVLKAADLALPDHPHRIELHKSLPIAAGIGGGSGNAAAVIRFAAALKHNLNAAQIVRLGADVPVCITSQPQRFKGIGEVLEPIDVFPMSAHILLVNPRVSVSTPQIFNTLTHKTNPAMPDTLPAFETLDTLVNFIAAQRNDLQGPAIAQQPVIAEVIDTITNTRGCLFSRMSGSGATCFGIYRKQDEALQAAADIRSNFPSWWIENGALQFQ